MSPLSSMPGVLRRSALIHPVAGVGPHPQFSRLIPPSSIGLPALSKRGAIGQAPRHRRARRVAVRTRVEP
jgi:hypothetical protein